MVSLNSRFFRVTSAVSGNSLENPNNGRMGTSMSAEPMTYDIHQAPTQLRSVGLKSEPSGLV